MSLFVGDAVEDILLIKPEEDGNAKMKVLANHNIPGITRGHTAIRLSAGMEEVVICGRYDECMIIFLSRCTRNDRLIKK